MKLKQLLSFIIILVPLQQGFAESFKHDTWDTLTKENVVAIDNGASTAVDYGAMKKQRQVLKAYLKSLSAVSQNEFNAWSEDEQLAFLINAYNAWTVELILTEWPDLKSIKDLGSLFSSPWSKEFIPLLGKTISLDTLEHSWIRGKGRYEDPRIHFAVNCASIGCPALRADAFTGEKLQAQLEEQTKSFLADDSRNRVTKDGVALSSIFKWYREDFEKGWHGYNRLEDFILNYADSMNISDSVRKKLKSGKADIDFLKYDWKLNSTKNK